MSRSWKHFVIGWKPTGKHIYGITWWSPSHLISLFYNTDVILSHTQTLVTRPFSACVLFIFKASGNSIWGVPLPLRPLKSKGVSGKINKVRAWRGGKLLKRKAISRLLDSLWRGGQYFKGAYNSCRALGVPTEGTKPGTSPLSRPVQPGVSRIQSHAGRRCELSRAYDTRLSQSRVTTAAWRLGAWD